MLRRLLVPAFALALVAFNLSCAAPGADDGLGPSVYDTPEARPGDASVPTMPAAKLGLPPEYRGFYDALADEGDWALIEPYGWCFRPAVNFVAWRPYQQGWWEPSDSYGWIWNSTEPFGWITYHYGSWFYDRFQGWVWQPGPVWGPAWVAWAMVDDFIGWAPLAPRDMQDVADAPDGAFQYVRAQAFASSARSTQSLFVSRLGDTRGLLVAVENIDRFRGVAFNRGPDFETLARMNVAVPQLVAADRFQRAPLPEGLSGMDEADLVTSTRRMLDVAARELARARGLPAPPPTILPIGGSTGGSVTPGGGGSRYKPGPAANPAPRDSVKASKPRLPRGEKGDRGSRHKPDAPADTTQR